MDKDEIDNKVIDFINRHKKEQDTAFHIVSDAFQKMKAQGVPTLITFKETEKHSQYLAMDFEEGFREVEISPFDILGAIIQRNEMEIMKERSPK